MPRQSFYFSDGPYLKAMQGLHAALSGSEAFIKFIGPPRTGKSGVCEKLTQFMGHKGYRVLYFDYAVESPDMLRSMLARELDIPDTVNMLRHLEDALAKESDKPLIIIFDDAHQLSDITLVEIVRLAGVQVDQKRVINLVLCGEPALEKRLNNKREFITLLHHVSHNFLIEPMSADTTLQFLGAFLENSQLPAIQLEPAAQNLFFKSCKGYPGPAFSLCQLLVSIRQHSVEQVPVTKEELQLAIRSADGEQSVPSSSFRDGNRWMIGAPVAAVLVIASLALLMRQLSPPDEESVEDVVPQLEEGSVAAGTDVASPFAIDEIAVEASITDTARDEGQPNTESQVLIAQSISDSRTNRESDAVIEEEPVSDSNLALVTAQERGIPPEILVEPDFESMASAAIAEETAQPALSIDQNESAPPQLASVTLTRPMLMLEEEEVELPDSSNEVVSQEIEELAVHENVADAAEDSIAVSEVEVSSAEQMVNAWVDAWQNQELEQYFASYDENFVPRYHRSKSAWRSNRERVIGNASQISLEISDFVMVSEDGETIEVHFWLAYKSPTYADDTRKKLILRRVPASNTLAASWLILEEINLEVRV